MKKFDYVILLAGVLVFSVFLFVMTGNNKSFSETPVEAEKTIAFDVVLRGVTTTSESSLFSTTEKTFLTIRNVPYKDLSVTQVKKIRRQAVLPALNTKKKYITVEDDSNPYLFDFVVTLKDDAKITADGPVVGGNKIKIGIPVVLEGADYKLSGVVSNLIILNEVKK